MSENIKIDIAADEHHEMLRKLLHLKRYETPETHRMMRNRQNIMRKVRHAKANRRKGLGDLLEEGIPWFFAEPKYGIALLFLAFVGLQYFEVNARNSVRSTGIYTPSESVTSYVQASSSISNAVPYPKLPSNLRLFDNYQDDGDVVMVEHLFPKR
ncbi:MAG TPA: hypothetical protein VIR63_02375 [Pontiella sp.]